LPDIDILRLDKYMGKVNLLMSKQK